MARTRAQQNRAMRQDELRQLLSKQKLVEKVIETAKEIDELANIKAEDFTHADQFTSALSAAKDKTQILKAGIDTRMKLISKYLPDLKQTELIGDPDNPLEHKHTHDLTDEVLEQIISE